MRDAGGGGGAGADDGEGGDPAAAAKGKTCLNCPGAPRCLLRRGPAGGDRLWAAAAAWPVPWLPWPAG